MTVDETLANYSNLLLYGAMVTYTAAFVAYGFDLAGGATRAERRREQAAHPELVGAGGVPVDGPPPVDVGEPASSDRRRAAAIGTSLTVLSLLLHVGAVALRGWSVQRAPWGNMFEFSTAGAAVVTAVYLVALRWRDLRYLGTFVVGPVLFMLVLALKVFYTEAGQLVPALKSFWLVIHVGVALVAAALFTIGFSATVLYLSQARREERRGRGLATGRSFMDALPTARELDRAAYGLHAVAFPLWTFTLVAGAIWAEKSWSRYWGWDAKEVWTFVAWVVYAGYLHARATRGWQGRKAAVIATVGFGCVLFNFLIVNLLFPGLHAYAK